MNKYITKYQPNDLKYNLTKEFKILVRIIVFMQNTNNEIFRWSEELITYKKLMWCIGIKQNIDIRF